MFKFPKGKDNPAYLQGYKSVWAVSRGLDSYFYRVAPVGAHVFDRKLHPGVSEKDEAGGRVPLLNAKGAKVDVCGSNAHTTYRIPERANSVAVISVVRGDTLLFPRQKYLSLPDASSQWGCKFQIVVL